MNSTVHAAAGGGYGAGGGGQPARVREGESMISKLDQQIDLLDSMRSRLIDFSIRVLGNNPLKAEGPVNPTSGPDNPALIYQIDKRLDRMRELQSNCAMLISTLDQTI